LILQYQLTQLGKTSDLLGTIKGIPQDLTKLVDGTVPRHLLEKVRKIYSDVEKVDCWINFCKFLDVDGCDSMNDSDMNAIIVRIFPPKPLTFMMKQMIYSTLNQFLFQM
jgi:hypothetical protein